MHIRYVINQHHYDKIKDYPLLIIKLKKHFYFQYIKLVYGYLFFLGDKDKKMSTYHAFTLMGF